MWPLSFFSLWNTAVYQCSHTLTQIRWNKVTEMCVGNFTGYLIIMLWKMFFSFLRHIWTHPRINDQIRVDIELFQVRVPGVTVALFHLISLVQVLQSGFCDVDTSREQQNKSLGTEWIRHELYIYNVLHMKVFITRMVNIHSHWIKNIYHLPWEASRLHVIGQSHIMWPHVKLPFAKPDDTAQHISWMHPDPHVDIHSRGLTHLPEGATLQLIRWTIVI